ncbi:MAG: outer membrane beta-barrel protein [Marinifilaceae bacterium]
MKKILLFAVILLSSITLFAQQQGQVRLGGDLSFSSNESKDLEGNRTTVTNVKVLPNVSYFISDNWAIGLDLGYEYKQTKVKGNDTHKPKTNLFVVGPRASYYLQITQNFYYTPGIYVNVGFGEYKNQETINGVTSKKADLFNLRAGLNLMRFEFMPTDVIGISFSIGEFSYDYLTYKYKDVEGKPKHKYNSFDLGLNFAPTIGFNYYF